MSRDIFIVSNSTDELGGVTAWTHQTARLFTEQGHRVHII
ncbi:glycosyltransferase family 4 protein, partial [Streptomyces sp. SID8455]|nr:glycosyltransferase family 4 protein [Streptomyces sp. SID8455]